jgi:hypothetical protein
MRFIFSFAILAASCCSTTFAGDINDLFSELAMESVFENETAESVVNFATPAKATRVERITGVSGLAQILKGEGLEHTVKGDRVELRLERSGWAFPVTLQVDVELERILLELSLVEIGEGKSLDQAAMLKLLSGGNAAQSAFFAFEPTEKLIQLRSSMSTRNVSGAAFIAELDRLALFADERSDLWSGLTKKVPATSAATASTSAPTTANPPASPPANPPARPSLSLLGQWTASVATGEAFAVKFDATGRFALVHLKGGKSNTSRGKSVRTGENLVLQGDDGTKLNGTLKWRSEKGFQLAINGADGKPAVRLEFKKQP